METTKVTKKRLNRLSYFLDLLILSPAFVLGIAIGRVPASLDRSSSEIGLIFIAQIISLLLVIPLVVWTVRRLHDLGKSGWFSLFLIPPGTIFLLIYLFVASYDKNENNKWGEHSEGLRLFGIEAKNLWRFILIILVVFFMLLLCTIQYEIYSNL